MANGELNLWQFLSFAKYRHWKVIDDPPRGLIKQVKTYTLETQGILPMGISLYSKLSTSSEMNIEGKTLPAILAIKICLWLFI